MPQCRHTLWLIAHVTCMTAAVHTANWHKRQSGPPIYNRCPYLQHCHCQPNVNSDLNHQQEAQEAWTIWGDRVPAARQHSYAVWWNSQPSPVDSKHWQLWVWCCKVGQYWSAAPVQSSPNEMAPWMSHEYFNSNIPPSPFSPFLSILTSVYLWKP